MAAEPVAAEKPKSETPVRECAITKEELDAAPEVDKDKVAEFFECASPDVFDAYETLGTFAREAGLVVEVPHFILVGPAGCGKSSLLEAIVGHPVVSLPDQPCLLFFFFHSPLFFVIVVVVYDGFSKKRSFFRLINTSHAHRRQDAAASCVQH